MQTSCHSSTILLCSYKTLNILAKYFTTQPLYFFDETIVIQSISDDFLHLIFFKVLSTSLF